MQKSSATILGVMLVISFTIFGLLIKQALLEVKTFDRNVTVKGLAEAEFPADIVIWPIQFTAAGNDLESLYNQVDAQAQQIISFLASQNIAPDEISFSSPKINDKLAQQYGGQQDFEFRYSALQTITVYSSSIKLVRDAMPKITELGKKGIVFSQNDYNAQVEYIFSRLNDVKPQMIEQSTTNARMVAEKFASDSNNRLGKIKNASQRQFSIGDRDKNNPHIKRVRVVSTIAYYLAD